jgi:hypothetical protein
MVAVVDLKARKVIARWCLGSFRKIESEKRSAPQSPENLPSRDEDRDPEVAFR